jgi:hypothetical protein
MQVGDLVQFQYINGHTSDINGKMAVFLGERPIHRGDGKIINNFAVQIIGQACENICDNGMRRWLKVVNESR